MDLLPWIISHLFDKNTVLRTLKNTLHALWLDLVNGGLNIRAASLVYKTFLSLVPLLALSFSVLKGFGIHNQMEPFLLKVMEPLGKESPNIVQQLLQFVDNIKVGALGVAGLAVLIYTVISLVEQIELAFNHTWRVNKGRRLSERFRDYLSVILVGPLLIFSAVGLTGALWDNEWIKVLHGIEPLGSVFSLVLEFSPTLILAATFTFLFCFVPNTRVKLHAALVGGIIATILWQLAGVAFASIMVNSKQQVAIYSIFTGLFLFVLWLYIAWFIILLGSNIAYYVQNPQALPPTHDQLTGQTSAQSKYLIAVAILRSMLEKQRQGDPPMNDALLKQALCIPQSLIDAPLQTLKTTGLIYQSDDADKKWLLAFEANQYKLEALRALFWEGLDEQKQQMQSLAKSLNLSEMPQQYELTASQQPPLEPITHAATTHR